MPGKTPLVGWIKGYMVPELMGIEVKIVFLLEKFNSLYNLIFVRWMMFLWNRDLLTMEG